MQLTAGLPSVRNQISGSEVAVNYLVSVNQLSAQIAPNAIEEQIQVLPKPFSDIISPFLPYTPFLLFIILFIAAFSMQVMSAVKNSKNLIVTILLSLFAASIPTALSYIENGSRQNVNASPETTPRMVQVQPVGTNGVQISWTTDADTLSIVKFAKRPLTESNGYIHMAKNSTKEKIHSVTIEKLMKNQMYQFEILSGSSWYNNSGAPVEFVFK